MAEPRHRRPRTRGGHRPSRRFLAALAAGLVGLVVGVGGAGTYAFWQDSATVTTGSLSAGRLDLQLDGANAAGLGTGYAKPGIAFSGLTPGERQGYTLSLHNVADTASTYQLTVARGAQWTYGDDAVIVQAFTGSPVPDGTPPRSDSCTGEPLAPPQLLDSAAPRTIVPTGRPLAIGASETVCLLVGLQLSAGNANQSKVGALRLDAVLTQVTQAAP